MSAEKWVKGTVISKVFLTIRKVWYIILRDILTNVLKPVQHVDFRFISAFLHAYLNQKGIHTLEFDVNVFEAILSMQKYFNVTKYRKVIVKNLLLITNADLNL